MTVRHTWQYLFGAVLLLLAAAAHAQPEIERPALPEVSGKPLVVDADTVTYDQQAGIIRGVGNVRINYQGVMIRADQAQALVHHKQIVAEGNITLEHEYLTLHGEYMTYDFISRRGALLKSHPDQFDSTAARVEALAEDQRIEADRIDFDLNQQEAIASSRVTLFRHAARVDGENLRYNFKSQQTEWLAIDFRADPWVGRAKKAVQKTPERVEFTSAYVTTCDHDSPHYRIQAKRIDYYVDDALVARHARVMLGNIPVLYVPYWKQSLVDNQSNFTLSAGHKKEWGGFALTTYRQRVNEYVTGRVHLDYRQLKGFAGGLDVDYTSDGKGEGAVKTYYMNERDTYEDDAQEQERYRAQYKHRWQVNPRVLALVEYNKISDRDFIKDYLYREYTADVQPATQASLTYAEPAYSLGVYARAQTNTFFSEVERLPEVRYTHNSQAVGESGVYYRHDIAAANLNKKVADTREATAVNRMDMYHEVKYPTKLPGDFDWITITPQIATRQTFYSRTVDASERDFWRGAYYYGGEATATFYRYTPFEGKVLGTPLHQVRHIMTPAIGYSFINAPTVPAYKLAAFDAIDRITAENVFTLGVQNHVQTKWPAANAEGWDPLTIVYWYPRVKYYPGRDSEDRENSYFSYIASELNVRPQRWLSFFSDTIYNQYDHRFESVLFDVALHHADRWRLSVGKRYDREVSDQTTGDIFLRINEFWHAQAYGRYEARTDTVQEQQYTVSRDLHCWLLDVTYSIKRVQDGSEFDRTLWFVFRLKAFPDVTSLRFNIGYDTVNR